MGQLRPGIGTLMRPACSVVIPSHNGKRLLETCLASLRRHAPQDVALEVIVVDDASTDDTAGWVAREYPEVRVVRLDCNAGFAVAANAGIAAARGEFIQLLNNDTEVTSGWLGAGLEPFRDPTVGSVAPLVLLRSDPSVVDSAGDTYGFVGWPTKRGHGESALRWLAHPGGRVFGASASSAFYRADAVQRVGAFDPAFGSYYEDVDLAFRLRWAGYSCVFAPACRILHDISASHDHARADLQRRMARNAERVFWTDLPIRWLIAAAVPHAAFTAAQCVMRVVAGRAGPFVAGKLDAVRELPRLMVRRRGRHDLARSSVAPPHFPIQVGFLGAVGNHLRRPKPTARPAMTSRRNLK